MTDFEGLVAVVTGGASGIGAATATLLRHRGARLVNLDRNTDGAPAGVLAITCDITDSTAVDRAIATVDRLGGVDILVNNAGIGATGDISQNSDGEWARVLDVNVTGIARVTRAALPRRSDHAVVVNMCSAVAFVGVKQRALYGASKGAELDLTQGGGVRPFPRGRQPLDRLVTPDEVAHAVASLASPMAASITGPSSGSTGA